ncbi:MAG: DUF4968 domain-containing protein [Candidatus Lokiarchaeota archaeon]|nr:DUF4968 domain-containing protein [Candidatus Lokiarchaeota archaeon]
MAHSIKKITSNISFNLKRRFNSMSVKISLAKQLWILFKNKIRHWNLRKKLSEFQPNAYFGYTDHPVDSVATPILTVFSAIGKLFRKKSKSVLTVELKEKTSRSFIFSAKAINIYSLKSRDLDDIETQKYVIKKNTKVHHCTIRIDFLKEDIYRLRFVEGEEIPDNITPMIYKDIQDQSLNCEFEEDEQSYTIKSAKLTLKIYKDDFRIEIYDNDGNLITESSGKTKNNFPNAMDAVPLSFIKDKGFKNQFGVESFVIYPCEAIYGLGEQFGPLNKIGQNIGLWQYEGLGNTSGRIYKNIPFFMSTRGYGVFINESSPIMFWIGSKEYCKNQFAVESDLVDYYFFYGDFKTILDNYTKLTGKAETPPKWSFGTWISRISYKSQDEVMNVAKKLRELNFPSDVIHIDTFWFKKDWECDWKFNKETFPNPKRMFSDLREQGFRVSLWQTPYISHGTSIFKEAKKEKVLAKNNGPFMFLTGEAHAIDFSSEKAIKWYQSKLRNLFELGASAIKVDFGEGIEPHMKFKKYKGRKMHNLYSLLYNKAAFEITKDFFGEGVIWARSAYAGSQRYPVHWSGDNSSNMENILCSLRGGLSLGLCGFTFWSQDTGGFSGTPTDEEYIRWTQLSIFQSHIRYHGTGPRFKEPWNYEPETQDIVRKFLNLRYQLIPYIYNESQIAAKQGLPLLRALVIEFPDDPTVYNIEDQFLCGRNLLIAPILTNNNTRKIYIPKGIWYDYWTFKKINGPQWITQTHELDSIPIFVRSGTILPLGPVVQSTDKMTNDSFILMIFPDSDLTASYVIKEKDTSITMKSSIKDEILTINTNPESLSLDYKFPSNLKISEIVINDTKHI